MQLFKVSTSTGITIQEEIKHTRFRDVLINNASGKEKDLESFLVQYPGLLNFGDFDQSDPENTDLLIISRQPTTSTRKRADLLGIHRDGSLIVIEVKRDAADERNRVEGIEFQAIRYAAASRKMTVDAIIETYARYLLSIHFEKEAAHLNEIYPVFIEEYRQVAVGKLCEHLADEEEELSEEDLEAIIDPKEKQKIYLVAADYEADVISACAWLREHNIDVSCFRLRPYRIAGEIVLERERLIPPPELGDYMTDIFVSPVIGGQIQPQARRKQSEDKPSRLIWADDEENPINVATWREMFAQVVRRALSDGLSPDKLPTRVCKNEDDAQRFQAPRFFESHNVWIDLHGSASAVQGFVRKILLGMNKQGLLTVETRNGNVIEF
ncbi:MAG TPA: hypothetical protein VF703_15100 [Pyrinomonadaceae bacterium]|jgi:hypothetical protein